MTQAFDEMAEDARKWMIRAGVAEAELAKLKDPQAVFINLLCGSIARPSISQICFVYGEKAFRAALSAAQSDRDETIAKMEAETAKDGEIIMQACKDLEECHRLLKWAQGCVPFPSACHSAIVKYLESTEGKAKP